MLRSNAALEISRVDAAVVEMDAFTAEVDLCYDGSYIMQEPPESGSKEVQNGYHLIGST